jgi:nucleoporin NUP1
LQTNNHPSKLPNRSSSVATPSTIQQQPRNRHTASPFRSNSFSRPESISRTMSMDPPHQRGITVDATMFTHHESSVEDNPPSSHGLSMPTARPPFRMRTSLTPSSRSSFGPISQKGAHVRSEPPPLTSLTSKPVFVRAPPYPSQGAISAQLPTTLGSLIDSQHNVCSLYLCISAR